jgi:predicted TIM-barrel fold metal-dependent hydrolase
MQTSSATVTCQPARTVVRKPKIAPPPLSCDCHSHVVGPQSEYPFVSDRSFTPPDASSEAYVAMLDTLGIDRMVVVQASVYGSDNRRTVDAVAEIGLDRARGVAMVPGDVSPAELQRLDDAGIRATRFITFARGGPTIDQLPEVAKAVAPFGWHIEMYLPLAQWEQILPIVQDLPVPVVFDHMGGASAGTDDSNPVVKAMLRLLEAERAWVKLTGYRGSLAGHPYSDVRDLCGMFASAVPERCVWGSDWPHTNVEGHMPDDGELLDLLTDWAPDEATRKRILVDNPAKLYRF